MEFGPKSAPDATAKAKAKAKSAAAAAAKTAAKPKSKARTNLPEDLHKEGALLDFLLDFDEYPNLTAAKEAVKSSVSEKNVKLVDIA